jgi:hypothetical protein
MSNVVPITKDLPKIESVDSFLTYERVFLTDENLAYMRMQAPNGDMGWYRATDDGFIFIESYDKLHARLEAAYQAYKKEHA